MAISQARSKRKQTGALYKAYRKKRKHELGRLPSLTKIDKKRAVSIRTRGGNRKVRLLSIETANLFNPKTKKHEQVKINNIIENPANRHFVRRNIITKGCIVETEKGKAKITSRPGQDGIVNAILVT
jgi:small subunit ribosomal protein S8e